MTEDVENRIRELCTLIATAKEGDFYRLLDELKLVLHEHSLKLENLIAAQRLLLMGPAAGSGSQSKEPREPKSKTA